MKKLFFACVILVSVSFAACGGSTKTAYQCPMKCEGEKTYDSAGKCPVCQMDMKEVK